MPDGHVAEHTDCDDGAADVNPGATEICDASNTDEDRDGSDLRADDNDKPEFRGIITCGGSSTTATYGSSTAPWARTTTAASR